ncbi:MAG: GDSL-type esterase/lipase family protein, partial [Spirochaetales bacterium]|nr:GDSL-type esterase/lipase family protein [Spirochaetales bacterium]
MPGSAKRYPFERRWTSVLERELGAGFRVVPEGLNGRTTVFEDPVSGDKCGYSHLRTVLESHKPIDLLIIMLGTNDLKDRFSLSAAEIAKAVGRLLDLALKSGAGLNQKVLSVLLISPPPIS